MGLPLLEKALFWGGGWFQRDGQKEHHNSFFGESLLKESCPNEAMFRLPRACNETRQAVQEVFNLTNVKTLGSEGSRTHTELETCLVLRPFSF